MRLQPLIIFISIALSGICRAQSQTNWSGWGSISNIFAFGDSYTTTLFQVNGTQPNTNNPLGNPAFPGVTFSNGRNWIDFLTYNYNDSLIFSYNFAVAGATVDSFGMPGRPRPMDQQVRQFFLPTYAPNSINSIAAWSSANSLFTTFFGINDVNFSLSGQANMTAVQGQIFVTYAQLIDELYQAGGRNFLFINVPAVHRSPLVMRQGNATVAMSRAAILDFNSRISDLAQNFTQRRPGTNVFLLDNFGLFNRVLDNPRIRPETSVYTNTTGFCPAYSARTYDEETFNSSCAIPQKEFFWLDVLHPTPPIHEAMAADIASLLRNGSSRISGIAPNASFTPGTEPPELSENNARCLYPSLAFALLPLVAGFVML